MESKRIFTTTPISTSNESQKALQGHPESLRLSATLIDIIIKEISFTPCHHKPCLYVNNNYNGEKIFFLRQVDAFSISARTTTITNKIIAKINSKIAINMKALGIISRFNGVDYK